MSQQESLSCRLTELLNSLNPGAKYTAIYDTIDGWCVMKNRDNHSERLTMRFAIAELRVNTLRQSKNIKEALAFMFSEMVTQL